MHRLASFVIILAVVTGSISCRYKCGPHGAKGSREVALQANLNDMRKAIDNYYEDKKAYPRQLDDLVPNYIRKIPPDPLTDKADWQIVRDGSDVVDVRTSARGKNCDGTDYQEL